jgi:hypothetical protein
MHADNSGSKETAKAKRRQRQAERRAAEQAAAEAEHAHRVEQLGQVDRPLAQLENAPADEGQGAPPFGASPPPVEHEPGDERARSRPAKVLVLDCADISAWSLDAFISAP